MKWLVIMALAATSSIAWSAETATEKQAREAANYSILMQHYPARALAAREEGAVAFKLSLDRDGDPSACAVTQSSGYPSLDYETCDLLVRFARFQPDRNSDGARTARTHSGVIIWTLPGKTAPTFVAGPAPVFARLAADPLDKKICKKALRIGTLAGYERTCRTRREWAAETDEMKRNWQEVQGSYGSTHGSE